MKLKLNLNENQKSIDESIELLAKMYIEIKAAYSEFVKISESDKNRQIKKNEEKIAACKNKIFKLQKESSVVAAGLPAIVSGDDFLLLHGCEVVIEDDCLRYEIVQDIYHNHGNGNVERAIKLFIPENDTGYDATLSWRANVQRVIEKHTENEAIVGTLFSTKPEMAEAERFLIKACEIIKDADFDTILSRTVKTESVIELAEKLMSTEQVEINVMRRADSVRDQILANQGKK